MKLLPASVVFVGVAATTRAAEEAADGAGGKAPSLISMAAYGDAQCERWIDRLRASDTDGQGGLSRDEFHHFLIGGGGDEAQYFDQYLKNETDSYEDLPWLFKISYNALACWCHALGMGDGCCVGADAKIALFDGLTDDSAAIGPANPSDQQKIEREYRANVCDFVAVLFEAAGIPFPQILADSTAPSAAPFAAPSAKPSLGRTLSPNPTFANPTPTEAPTKTTTNNGASQPSPVESTNALSTPRPSSPNSTTDPGAPDVSNVDRDVGGGVEAEGEPRIALGIALGAAAFISFSVAYVFFPRKKEEEDEASLDNIRNQDLEDFETGGRAGESGERSLTYRVSDEGNGNVEITNQ